MGLTARDYIEGLVFFSATLLPALLGAELARRRWFGDLRGSQLALACGLAASLLVALAAFLPGVAGVATRWTVAGTSVALAVVLLRLAHRTPPSRSGGAAQAPPAGAASPSWSWAFAAVGAAAVIAGGLAFLLARSAFPVAGTDAMAFHLPTVVRWIQTGSLWEAVELQPELSSGAYPHTGNLMYLVAMLPWSSGWTARYVGVPFLALAAVGIYALARALGAARPTSVLAAAAVCATYAVAGPALDVAMVDVHFLAWFTAGAVFLLRWIGSRGRRDLVLAGLGLGLALGTKWYALPYVPVVLLVWSAALLLAGRARREVGRALVGVSVLTVAIGGFWLLRNLVAFGNPLQPSPVRLLGITIFDAPPNPVLDAGGFAVRHYLTDLAVWDAYLLPALWRMLGGVLPLLGLGAAAAVVVAVRDLRGPRRAPAARVLAVAVAGILLAILYTTLPYTAMGPRGRPVLAEAGVRYLVPALVAAAALMAWLATRAPRARLLIELALLAAVLDGVRRAYPGVAATHVAVAIAISALMSAAAVAAWRPRDRLPRAAVAGGAAALLFVAAAGGRWLQARSAGTPYGSRDATIAWLETNSPHGAKVALAGDRSSRAFVPIFAAFGPRFGNRVEFLGRIERGTMRSHRRRDAYVDAVSRGGYDLVLLARGRDPQPQIEPPQLEWTESAGYRPVARSPFFVLLRRR